MDDAPLPDVDWGARANVVPDVRTDVAPDARTAVAPDARTAATSDVRTAEVPDVEPYLALDVGFVVASWAALAWLVHHPRPDLWAPPDRAGLID